MPRSGDVVVQIRVRHFADGLARGFGLQQQPGAERLDFGALAAPGRRGSCLAGLGYPASTRVLGAQPVEVRGRPAILLLLPGDAIRTVIALAVAPSCSSADTGLLVDTTVARP